MDRTRRAQEQAAPAAALVAAPAAAAPPGCSQHQTGSQASVGMVPPGSPQHQTGPQASVGMVLVECPLRRVRVAMPVYMAAGQPYYWTPDARQVALHQPMYAGAQPMQFQPPMHGQAGGAPTMQPMQFQPPMGGQAVFSNNAGVTPFAPQPRVQMQAMGNGQQMGQLQQHPQQQMVLNQVRVYCRARCLFPSTPPLIPLRKPTHTPRPTRRRRIFARTTTPVMEALPVKNQTQDIHRSKETHTKKGRLDQQGSHLK